MTDDYTYTYSPYTDDNSQIVEQIGTKHRHSTGETKIRCQHNDGIGSEKKKKSGSKIYTKSKSLSYVDHSSSHDDLNPPTKMKSCIKVKSDDNKLVRKCSHEKGSGNSADTNYYFNVQSSTTPFTSSTSTTSHDYKLIRKYIHDKGRRKSSNINHSVLPERVRDCRCCCPTHDLKVCLQKSLSGNNIHMAEIDWPDFDTDGLIVIWRRDEELIALPVTCGRVGFGVHELRDRGTSILQQQGFTEKDTATLQDLLQSKFASLSLNKHANKADERSTRRLGTNKSKHNNISLEQISQSEDLDKKINQLITQALDKERGEKTPKTHKIKRKPKCEKTLKQERKSSNKNQQLVPQIPANTSSNNRGEMNPNSYEPTTPNSCSKSLNPTDYTQQVQTLQVVEQSVEVNAEQPSSVCYTSGNQIESVNTQQMLLVNQTASQTRAACLTGVAVTTQKEWIPAGQPVKSKRQRSHQLRSLIDNVDSDFCDSMYLELNSSDFSENPIRNRRPPTQREFLGQKFLKSDYVWDDEDKLGSEVEKSEGGSSKYKLE